MVETYIRGLPKVELHLHIEGTLEPELMFELAQRNSVKLRYPSVEAVREAYQFDDLQSFLDLYYEGAAVLQKEQDFDDLTWAYLRRAHEDRVVHTEIFFDPQTHTDRGVAFDTVVHGIRRALERGRRELGISSKLILCFLRHLPEEQALKTLDQAKPYLHWIDGVGLDSSERDFPPENFERAFFEARQLGLRAVAHAGEEGPPAYIWSALDRLRVERIDHGVRSLEDPVLVERLARERIPLTVCPLSNEKLRVFNSLEEHNLAELLARGLNASVHSDDPAYFGGFIGENFQQCARRLDLSLEQLEQLAMNAVESSWMHPDDKVALKAEIVGCRP